MSTRLKLAHKLVSSAAGSAKKDSERALGHYTDRLGAVDDAKAVAKEAYASTKAAQVEQEKLETAAAVLEAD